MLIGPALAVAVLAGCGGLERPAGPVEAQPSPASQPVRRSSVRPEQQRACPEAVTGRFESLADFEDPGAVRGGRFVVEPSGAGQVQHVLAAGSAPSGRSEEFVRTGRGGLAVTLWGQAELVFRPASPLDMGEYPLMCLAVFSPGLRGDLVVTLQSGEARWGSSPVVLRRGWTSVRIDLEGLSAVAGFDASAVEAVRLGLRGGVGEVTLGLDDLLLVDNARRIEPAPEGLAVRRRGDRLSVTLPGRSEPVQIAPGGDGLFRMGSYQPRVRLAGAGESLDGPGEAVSILGERRVGLLEVLEHNAVRFRVGLTWCLPRRAGRWASMESVHRLGWEATVYGDGRWVTHARLNNAGGGPIAKVLFELPGLAGAWAGGRLSRTWRDEDFVGPIGRWSCLMPPAGGQARQVAENYLAPGAVELLLGREGVFAAGDADRDGFDESQGCYVLAGLRGHCRFRIVPPAGGLVRPVFRVLGPWSGPVSVNFHGKAIRTQARLADGSVLFAVPETLARPVRVEVFGSMRQGPGESRK